MNPKPQPSVATAVEKDLQQPPKSTEDSTEMLGKMLINKNGAQKHDVDRDEKGQDYSEPSRSLKEEADKITLSSIKANTVGENQVLMDRYQ